MVDNKFTPGHPESVTPFRTNGSIGKRPFMPATHPEMPSAGKGVHAIRRALADFHPCEIRLALRALESFTGHDPRHVETEARRMGLL